LQTTLGLAGRGVNSSQRAIAILGLIRKQGSMLCTGSCHHQKKEDLHCRQIGKILNMSYSTVWDYINHFLNEGIVERERVNNGPVNFNITLKGEELLRQADDLCS
jgi:predicted transcriptional regulator